MKNALKVFLKDIFDKKTNSLGAGTMVRVLMTCSRDTRAFR